MRILCLSVIYSITAMCLSGFDVMENSCIPQPDQDIRKVSPWGISLVHVRKGILRKDLGRDAGAVLITLSSDFWIGQYEIKESEYNQVMGADAHQVPDSNYPVSNISWFEAMRFCQVLTQKSIGDKSIPEGYLYRLPTSAEWEYACRAGAESRYFFGEDPNEIGKYAWINRNADKKTHPVGLKEANPWGLYDVYGNVSEMTLDSFRFASERLKDSVDPLKLEVTTSTCVTDCGGSYRSSSEQTRSTSGLGKILGRPYVGFRIVLAKKPKGYDEAMNHLSECVEFALKEKERYRILTGKAE